MARPSAASSRARPLPDAASADAVLLIANAVGGVATAGLCAAARAILANSGTDVIACDVSALVGPDMETVDALARLCLLYTSDAADE